MNPTNLTSLCIVQEVLDKLRAVGDIFPKPYNFGTFDKAFHLRVTRPGCEFDGEVAPESDSITELLPDWFENAAVSGYGDMRVLETKVDPSVRDAREILANDFIVDSSLLEQIRETWATNFFPRKVRVEPYKINIYGPGGHFESHRDTPEVGLVGTFLVGLGETNTYSDSRNFCIGAEKLSAVPCSWVAFYPDVPHAVSTIRFGHRASLAFKIFYVDGVVDEQEAACHSETEERLVAVFAGMSPPFGILLKHMYHMGISQLNGLDAILFSAARQMQQVQVHLLPIVIRSQSTVYYDVQEDEDSASDVDSERDIDKYDEYDDHHENSYNTSIHPFTSAHVDYILTGNREAREKTNWLQSVQDVPFYSWDFKTSVMEWERQTQEINFTGNDADGEDESCIYVSHALLILPDNADPGP